MPQKQGSSTSNGGRLDGSCGSAVTAANFAIGAGWGGTATFEIAAGSTDQVGTITITASATTPAQATATVTLTFADGAYAAAPIPFVVLAAPPADALTFGGPINQACTTTALSWVSSVVPVATKIYKYNYCVIAGR
jgi:hypothetical protein